MSAVSLPVTRPVGRALLVGSAASRVEPLATLERLGFATSEADDPYAAMTEICRRPLIYRALIVSLASFYREELAIVEAVKRRFPHIEVWLAQTDGRQASLADGMRLGADGLLADDGLHRVAVSAPPQSADLASSADDRSTNHPNPLESRITNGEGEGSDSAAGSADAEFTSAEPVLTAEELHALLQEQPASPPSSEG